MRNPTSSAARSLLSKISGRSSQRFALTVALVFGAFSVSAHANPACEQLFRETRPRTDIETLQAVQALVPRSQYRLSNDETLKIASRLGLTVEETHFELARVAATRKSTPISNFGVGAVGVTASGDVFLGANIEFRAAAVGLTIHAERTVLLLANEAGVKIEKLYSTVTPCGGCRQWLNEIEGGKDLQIISKDKDGNFFSKTLAELLPLDFGPATFGQKGLMDPAEPRGRTLARVPIMIGGLNRAQVKALVGAVASSYTPYTNSPAGALIQLKDGVFVTGSYVESAAYESYSPVAVALAKLKMMGIGNEQITALYIMVAPPARVPMLIDHVSQAELLLPSMIDEKFDGAGLPIVFRSIVLRPRM